jgi:4-hydroxybenzoate polyprenyltransferase
VDAIGRRVSTAELLTSVGQVGRTSLSGVTFGFVLLGAASAATAAEGRVGIALAAAAAFHLSVYAWNDVIDLPVDRTQPRRAASPLTRGVVRPSTVAMLATMAGLTALALAAIRGPAALAWMAAALAALAVYNVLGKRVRLTPLTDLVQGLGWAALVAYGAAAADEPTAATAWIAAYTALVIVLVNGVHGGVRDLANDHAAGARTTAMLLGARPLAGGSAVIPRALRAYAIAIQVAVVAILLAGLADLGGSALSLRFALAILGGVACMALLAAGMAPTVARPPSWRLALAHILLLLLLPILFLVDDLSAGFVVAFAVLFGGPWAAVGKPLRHGRMQGAHA